MFCLNPDGAECRVSLGRWIEKLVLKYFPGYITLKRMFLQQKKERTAMKWSEGGFGRIFTVLLEDEDTVPGTVESFCKDQGIARGVCFFVGGIKSGELVVGPENPGSGKITPRVKNIESVSEMSATGTIFPDDNGLPRLHMHAALGAGEKTMVGCTRRGLTVWMLGEVVIIEIKGSKASRKLEPSLGIGVLEP